MRVALSDAVPLVTTSDTVTLPAACGLSRFRVATDWLALSIEYRSGFCESTLHAYVRFVPTELRPSSVSVPLPMNSVTFGTSAICASTVGPVPWKTASMQPWKRSNVKKFRPHSA